MNDEPKTPQETPTAGSACSAGLSAMIERLERESFEKWYIENRFNLAGPIGGPDFLRMWFAWKSRGELHQPCHGARREGCGYLAPCGALCDKCGQIH